MNIFSGLNQLDDISLNKFYSSICGISGAELEQYFEPEISAIAELKKLSYQQTKEKLARMYDGYHFTHDVEGVYNPFCLLKCFREKDFGSYWFESGTPSFLVKTLQNQPLFLANLINGRKAIDANGYSDRFAVSGKTMYKIGVVFSSEGKGIVGWKVGN